MLPNSVLTRMLLLDKLNTVLATSQPLNASSAGSLYRSEPYTEVIPQQTVSVFRNMKEIANKQPI